MHTIFITASFYSVFQKCDVEQTVVTVHELEEKQLGGQCVVIVRIILVVLPFGQPLCHMPIDVVHDLNLYSICKSAQPRTPFIILHRGSIQENTKYKAYDKGNEKGNYSCATIRLPSSLPFRLA